MNAASKANLPGKYRDRFEYCRDIDGAWVEPPNHRRNGLSGVKIIITPDEGSCSISLMLAGFGLPNTSSIIFKQL